MAEWVELVGDRTVDHRERRAREHERKAGERRAKLRSDGWGEFSIKQAGKWHQDRAKGQRQRIETVLGCGGTTLRMTCAACGKSHERPQGCRVGLLCVRCRSAIGSEKRAAFMRARRAVLSSAQHRGLLSPLRPKGPYGEKFLTLTAPHVRTDSILGRIERVLAAWRLLLRRLNQHFRANGIRSAEWYRVFEWTPGDDDRGHPHLHVWVFCPFLPLESIRSWWRTALAQADCPAELAVRAIVHIEEITESDGGARELIKYLTKDITDGGQKLDPQLYAQVYKALDGRRSTQSSRGFMSKAKRERQVCECGSDLPPNVQRITNSDGE